MGDGTNRQIIENKDDKGVEESKAKGMKKQNPGIQKKIGKVHGVAGLSEKVKNAAKKKKRKRWTDIFHIREIEE